MLRPTAVFHLLCSHRTAGDAAWLAVQEAAKHCTAVRMRTHLGNPAQTFAALEHMLQGMLSKLNTVSSSTQPDPLGPPSTLYSAPAARTSPTSALLEPSMMLLEFMHALEKNMYCTYAGSCLRPGVSGNAVAFYKSNRKVCWSWCGCMSKRVNRSANDSTSTKLLPVAHVVFMDYVCIFSATSCTAHRQMLILLNNLTAFSTSTSIGTAVYAISLALVSHVIKLVGSSRLVMCEIIPF